MKSNSEQSAMRAKKSRTYRGLNSGRRIQSPVCYHYTIRPALLTSPLNSLIDASPSHFYLTRIYLASLCQQSFWSLYNFCTFLIDICHSSVYSKKQSPSVKPTLAKTDKSELTKANQVYQVPANQQPLYPSYILPSQLNSCKYINLESLSYNN